MTNNKFENLLNDIENMAKEGICIAFSGGVDSSLLLYLCKDFSPKAVTFNSIFHTNEEIKETEDFCQKYNINQKIIEVFPLNDEIISNNPKERCYYCKKNFFSRLKDYANQNNIKYIFDGTNFDDTKTYRPGLKALEELGIISPFAKHKITKAEIRQYAMENNLSIYNKPSIPCLATRFPYNTKLTAEKIEIVKQGEKILKAYGFNPLRLRLHDNIARIEIEKDRFNDFLNKKEELIKELKNIGITYITLDLEGIRSGSMDINNFEIFLKSIDSDIKKIFEHQQEYIFCKKGCSYCCEQGDYPLSEPEFEYLMQGYNKLDSNIKSQIQENIKKLKQENKNSYTCPFLIDRTCTVYKYRPFVCRTFGVLTEDSKGNPAFPFCSTKGLNYSQIYDSEKQHLSYELVEKNNFKNIPKFFRLNNKVIMNLPLAKQLNINFGQAKKLIDFFE